MIELSSQPAKEQLNHLFGSYKAEWLKELLFDLFTEPSYFPELETSRPCVLQGGRGTGKTTVLRCLSYEGQKMLGQKKTFSATDLRYYGFYHRINTNRVTAFQGPELSDEVWISLFAHYFNLVLCELTFTFLRWFENHERSIVDIGTDNLRHLALSLHINPDDGLGDTEESKIGLFSTKIAEAKVRFEAYINNVVDGDRPKLSLQGAPLDILFSAIQTLPEFKGKDFFFLIDEYENLLPYQQRVVNTLIKHSGQIYTFKIGVRELGITEKATLNPNEQLISPSDYVKINIADRFANDSFKDFALSVCNGRIQRVDSQLQLIRDVRELLPGVSDEEEALLLGVESKVKEITSKLKDELSASNFKGLAVLTPLQIYFLSFWADSQNSKVSEAYYEYLADQKKWQEKYENYRHALLFTIRRRKSGIHKYYAGWDVFIRLAGNNIRYLLELVDQSLVTDQKADLTQPISLEMQTRAAQNTGKKNLSELEGLSVHGAQLKKLLLSLGRIYQVMAGDAVGHAPEVNQFHISDPSLTNDVELLLKAAVMHLALLRFPGNKLTDEADTREHDYMVHPIFSAFFEFSYRRKRKMTLTGAELLGLVKEPKKTLREILARTERNLEGEQPLPEQMQLFEGYYYGPDA